MFLTISESPEIQVDLSNATTIEWSGSSIWFLFTDAQSEALIEAARELGEEYVDGIDLGRALVDLQVDHPRFIEMVKAYL